MYESINETLRNSFYHNNLVRQYISEAERQVVMGEKTSFAAAKGLLNMYFKGMGA